MTYIPQAVSEMVRQLRAKRSPAGQGEDDKRDGGVFNGLVLANGGVLTYQHVVCLSTQPRRDGKQYQEGNPCPDVVRGSTVRVAGEGSMGWSAAGDGSDIVGSEGVGSGVWEAVIEVRWVFFGIRIALYEDIFELARKKGRNVDANANENANANTWIYNESKDS